MNKHGLSEKRGDIHDLTPIEVELVSNVLKEGKYFYLTKETSELIQSNRCHVRLRQLLNFNQLAISELAATNYSGKNEIYCCLNFDEVKNNDSGMEAFGFYDYFDFVKLRQCPLSILKSIHNLLKPSGKIHVICSSMPEEHIVNQLMHCANFENVRIESNLITANAREMVSYNFYNKYKFKEVSKLHDLLDVIDHAHDLFPDKNYNSFLDSIFIPNSTFFVCKNVETEKIVNFLRLSWRINGYMPPYALANHPETKTKNVKDRGLLTGEIFSPLSKSVEGYRCYKELVLNVLKLCLRNSFEQVYTTCNADDDKSKKVFTSRFGFTDPDIQLQYGDFKGVWSLLEGEPREMKNILEEKIFNTPVVTIR